MQSSHIPWKWKRRVCTDFWKSKRRGDEKEKNGFGIITAETRGHVLLP
jgi:hypothetical protein